MSYDIRFKRVYQNPGDDGARVLVDRLWPRGKRAEELALSEWYRNAAPSTALRRDWHTGRLDDETFTRRYRSELDAAPEQLTPLLRFVRQGPLTLLTAVRDPQHSHLPILRQALFDALTEEDRQADGRESASPVCYAGMAED